jgi:hypothetical protein
MTIEEFVEDRMFNAKAVAFGCWLLFAAGLIFLPDGGNLKLLIIIPFVGFGASILYILFFVCCPKCHAPLGQAMSSANKPNFCPGCGISLKERV